MGPGAGIAAQDVLICGWGDSTFMVALLHSMDEELPKGSQVTVLNLRSKEEVFGERLQASISSCSLKLCGPVNYLRFLGVAKHACIMCILRAPAIWVCE